MIFNNERILITGSSGLIGSALYRSLVNSNNELIGLDSKNDLRIAENAYRVFSDFKPTIVFHLAAKVGGIYANNN